MNELTSQLVSSKSAKSIKMNSNVLELSKAEAGNLKPESPKHGHSLVVRPKFEPGIFGTITQYHNHKAKKL